MRWTSCMPSEASRYPHICGEHQLFNRFSQAGAARDGQAGPGRQDAAVRAMRAGLQVTGV